MIRYLILTLLVSVASYATEDIHVRLQKTMEQKLDQLVDIEKFKNFVKDNPEYFPGVSAKKPTSLIVKREEWILDNEKYPLSNGYRQIFIEGSPQTLKDLWTSPDLFSKVYELDSDGKVDGSKNTKKRFQARIYKKVPIVADQDYTLDYEVTEKEKLVFVRARLVKDNGEFALRDNFKVIEPVEGGMIVTVVDYIYPLSGIVRALGPVVRNTLRDELQKLNLLEKCFVEQGKVFPPAEEIFKTCHELIKPKRTSRY